MTGRVYFLEEYPIIKFIDNQDPSKNELPMMKYAAADGNKIQLFVEKKTNEN